MTTDAPTNNEQWQETKAGLHKAFTFLDFQQAFTFMQAVARVAERMQHHPRWHNTYNHVEVWLSTHEADGAITEKDRQLAEAIDSIIASQQTVYEEPHAATAERAKLYADGGSRGNPGPSASGFVIFDTNDHVLVEKGVYLGLTTNNQAEYLALKYGLEEAQKMGIRVVDVFMDSLLVVNQMKGIFKVRNRDLWPIHQSIKDMLPQFKQVTFSHVPRELNKHADRMVNESLDNETK